MTSPLPSTNGPIDACEKLPQEVHEAAAACRLFDRLDALGISIDTASPAKGMGIVIQILTGDDVSCLDLGGLPNADDMAADFDCEFFSSPELSLTLPRMTSRCEVAARFRFISEVCHEALGLLAAYWPEQAEFHRYRKQAMS